MTGAVWVLVLFVSVFFVVLETSAQNKARERIIEERQEQEALKKSLGLYVGFYKDSLCASQYKKEWVKHLEIRNHTIVDSSYESALALYIGNDQSKQVHYNLFVEKALKTIDELTQIVDWLYTISD